VARSIILHLARWREHRRLEGKDPHGYEDPRRLHDRSDNLACSVHLCRFHPARKVKAVVQKFGEIDVQRLNVREADGTLRMVISNRGRLPGVIVRGKENPPVDRPSAGMIFYNDEGTENGGLVFSGHRNANGEVVDSGVSLSFDRYGANSQFVQLAGVDDSQNHIQGTRPVGY